MKRVVYFLGVLIVISTIVAISMWFNQHWPAYLECIEEHGNNNGECFEKFISSSPPIQNAYDIENACDKSDIECLKKTGQIIVENKIEERVT